MLSTIHLETLISNQSPHIPAIHTTIPPIESGTSTLGTGFYGKILHGTLLICKLQIEFYMKVKYSAASEATPPLSHLKPQFVTAIAPANA